MSGIQLQSVGKIYPNGFQAIHGVDLEIHDGEFMVFVGPSGCAKSTLLRMIAGLEDITQGHISIGKRCVNDLLPKERGVAMVFQNYALYPHMTIYKNMAFSLQGKMNKQEIDVRVRDAARKLEIETLLDKKPGQLSGGQCQRVAVGRAIVRKPEVFLFDEPLSNLDAKLRVSMRVRLTELHRQLRQEGVNATMVYVTHDQIEAMTMGDRICVLNGGRIMQVDTPGNIYHQPKNKFVAGFIGNPAMNIHLLALDPDTHGLRLDDALTLPLTARLISQLANYPHDSVWFGIRPEAIQLAQHNDPAAFDARVTNVERMGNEDLLHFNIGAQLMILRVNSSPDWNPLPGESIKVKFNLDAAFLFDKQDEENLARS
ncbi:TPA: sn-glycerol-3-phosphate ABC transporter ATP-binding protein UgpC [Citrobacter amalonaticus]|nr:sn-glycerol-3-phosphate ABC transporter ATP-binding protein UgpC [Citrobacter amalonaticus]